MTQPTQDDIDRLVQAVAEVDGYLERYKNTIVYSIGGSHPLWQTVHEALIPLQPDPEADVIKAMAEAMARSDGFCMADGGDDLELMAKDALPVVKKAYGIPLDAKPNATVN